MKYKLNYIIIALILLFGFLINNSFEKIPIGTDMQNHIGAVNNILAGFKSDIGPFPYPNSQNALVSFLVSITNLEVPLAFHLIHFILILTIVLGFYRLGYLYNERIAYLLPFLVVIYYSSQDWLGLAYAYPSTFMIFIIPYFLYSLVKQNFKWVFFWFL